MDLESYLSELDETYEVLTDTTYAGAYYFSSIKVALICWKKQCSFEEYKDVFYTILKKHKQSPVHYFLSDIRNQGLSSNEKKEWLKEVAIKEAADTGLKKGAVIVDNNPFKQFYTNIILSATNTMGLPFKTFSNISDAKNWFLNQ